jgi:hypothetical protein
MTDYQAVDGGESRRDQIRHRMEDEFFAATEGDDFVGVQTYSRARVGPTARSATRRASTSSRWATSTGPTRCPRPSAVRGR